MAKKQVKKKKAEVIAPIQPELTMKVDRNDVVDMVMVEYELKLDQEIENCKKLDVFTSKSYEEDIAKELYETYLKNDIVNVAIALYGETQPIKLYLHTYDNLNRSNSWEFMAIYRNYSDLESMLNKHISQLEVWFNNGVITKQIPSALVQQTPAIKTYKQNYDQYVKNQKRLIELQSLKHDLPRKTRQMKAQIVKDLMLNHAGGKDMLNKVNVLLENNMNLLASVNK